MPAPVLLTGSRSTWTEPGCGQGQGARECPVCSGRDFDRERKLRYDRTCLRCLRNTWDPPHWAPPPWGAPHPDAGRTAEAVRQQARRERRTQATKASRVR